MSNSSESYEEQLLRQETAREELIKRGYVQDPCPCCDGSGRLTLTDTAIGVQTKVPCTACDGRGYRYVKRSQQ
jgi:DnaJ-class molecular chaperone